MDTNMADYLVFKQFVFDEFLLLIKRNIPTLLLNSNLDELVFDFYENNNHTVEKEFEQYILLYNNIKDLIACSFKFTVNVHNSYIELYTINIANTVVKVDYL